MNHPRHAEIRLAINLIDATDKLLDDYKRMLVGRVDYQSPVRPDSDVVMVSGIRSRESKETALPFFPTCDLLTVAKIIDKIRAHDAVEGDSPTRVYIQRKKGGTWVRLSGTVTLTEKLRGKVRLSTKVFPIEVLPTVFPMDETEISL